MQYNLSMFVIVEQDINKFTLTVHHPRREFSRTLLVR